MQFRLRRRCTLPPGQVGTNLRRTAHYAGTECDPLQSGMRWTEAMEEAVVKLRAIYLSGDFDRYWPFHIELDERSQPEPMTATRAGRGDTCALACWP